VVIAGFIADFVAPSARLIVEVDGGCHARRCSADARRDRCLRRAGYRVLRLPAELVLHNLPVQWRAFAKHSTLDEADQQRCSLVDDLNCEPPRRSGCPNDAIAQHGLSKILAEYFVRLGLLYFRNHRGGKHAIEMLNELVCRRNVTRVCSIHAQRELDHGGDCTTVTSCDCRLKTREEFDDCVVATQRSPTPCLTQWLAIALRDRDVVNAAGAFDDSDAPIKFDGARAARCLNGIHSAIERTVLVLSAGVTRRIGLR
jgi:hypothetical protein